MQIGQLTTIAIVLIQFLVLHDTVSADQVYAVNFRSDASFPPFNGIARFDSNGNPLSNFSVDDGPSSFGMWDTTYDSVTGKLYGIGTLQGGLADRVRVWDTDGTFSDINLDYTSAFGSNTSAFQQNSPDLAVHNGTIAVNFRSDASFPPFNGIARFDSNGNPLSNFSIDDGPSSFGMWDIAFDADGNLHGIGVLNGGFADRIRVWGTDGMFSDINLDYTSAFGSNASAYQRRSPDLAVFSSTTAVPEPSSVLFIASGLGALAFRRGRRAIRNTP